MGKSMRHVKKEKSKTQKNRQISILSKKYYEKKTHFGEIWHELTTHVENHQYSAKLACIPLKNAKINKLSKNTRKENKTMKKQPPRNRNNNKKKLEKLGFAVALKKFQK